MARRDAIAQISNLRTLRSKAGPDLSISDDVGRVIRDIGRSKRTAKGLDTAQLRLAKLAPRTIAQACTLLSLSRGVLTLRCEDSASAYQVDHWLRAGGLALLRSAESPAGMKTQAIVRVRITQ